MIDSEGNKLTKEQEIYFKDSKVRDYQESLLVYTHDTNKDFNESLKTRIIYTYPREVQENEVILYHQTTKNKLKDILSSGIIKKDVWSQEDIDTWNYGDFAIGFVVNKDKVHKANSVDRIIYDDIHEEDFIYILNKTGLSKKGKENFLNDFNLNESILLEKTRQELINKSKNADSYSKNNQARGKNRWERRRYSQISNSVRDYNDINMDAFWKGDILEFGVKVKGETNNYVVLVTFEGILSELRREVQGNNNKLEFKCV